MLPLASMLAAKPQVVWRLPFGSEHVWQRLGFCFRLGVLGHSNVCSRHFAVDVQTVDGLLRFLLASACWLLTSGAATCVGDVFAIAVSLPAWSVAQRPSHQLLFTALAAAAALFILLSLSIVLIVVERDC